MTPERLAEIRQRNQVVATKNYFPREQELLDYVDELQEQIKALQLVREQLAERVAEFRVKP